MAHPLQDQRVVVTGTAGFVGGGIATYLLDCGMSVLGVDRLAPLPPTPEIARYEHVVADLADAEAVQALARGSQRVHHIVHAAGGASAEDVELGERVPDALDVDATIARNLASAINILRSFREPLAREAATGANISVLLISSIDASRPFGLPAYAAAKAGLLGAMMATVRDFARLRVRINILELGNIDHPGVRELHSGSPDHFERLIENAPFRRLVTLADVAHAAEFVLSSLSLAGQKLVLDAGESFAAS